MNKIHRTIRKGFQVRRYHTEPIIQEETVGHHTANVIGILFDFYHPWPVPHGVLIHALLHDVPECYTGDIPAPAKKENPDLAVIVNQMDRNWCASHMLVFPILREGEWEVFKWADAYDCVLKFSFEVHTLGNQALRGPLDNALAYLNTAYLSLTHEDKITADLYMGDIVENPNERE